MLPVKDLSDSQDPSRQITSQILYHLKLLRQAIIVGAIKLFTYPRLMKHDANLVKLI